MIHHRYTVYIFIDKSWTSGHSIAEVYVSLSAVFSKWTPVSHLLHAFLFSLTRSFMKPNISIPKKLNGVEGALIVK